MLLCIKFTWFTPTGLTTDQQKLLNIHFNRLFIIPMNKCSSTNDFIFTLFSHYFCFSWLILFSSLKLAKERKLEEGGRRKESVFNGNDQIHDELFVKPNETNVHNLSEGYTEKFIWLGIKERNERANVGMKMNEMIRQY